MFKESLKECLSFVDIDFDMDSDFDEKTEAALLDLEMRHPETRLYPLIVATTPIGLRGFDYRAPALGINFIQAASFANHRDAL